MRNLKGVRIMKSRLAMVLGVGLLVAIPVGGMRHASADETVLISDHGLGAIKIGMTVEQVERAADQRLEPIERAVFGDSCWVTRFVNSNDKVGSLFYFVFGFRRLTVIGIENGNAIAKNLRTTEGIGFGSTLADIKRAYGPKLKIYPAPDFDDSDPYRWVEAINSDKSRTIIFQTDHDKVVGIRLGVKRSVESIEDCL